MLKGVWIEHIVQIGVPHRLHRQLGALAGNHQKIIVAVVAGIYLAGRDQGLDEDGKAMSEISA